MMPGQRDDQTPIVQLLIGCHPTGAADRAQTRRLFQRAFLRRRRPTSTGCRIPMTACARHHGVDHLEIARLENIERQRRARQQDGAAEREDGNPRRQIGRTAIAIR